VIRIRKGGREFTAKRIEVVRELARRGLLGADDPISIDDGPFVPASQVPQIAECLQSRPANSDTDTDPWYHWSSTSLDSGEWEAEAEGVLSSFLDVVTASSMPTLQALLDQEAEDNSVPVDQLTTDPERSLRHSDPDAFPPSLSAVAPVADPSDDELDGDDDESDASTVADTEAPRDDSITAQQDATPPDVATTSGDEARARDEAPAPNDDAPALPVSFTQWLENRGESDDVRPLGRLGGRDDSVLGSPSQAALGRFSALRVIFVLVVGFALVGLYRTYIRTGALSEFPTEEQLQTRVAPSDGGPEGDTDAVVGAADAAGQGAAQKSPSAPSTPVPGAALHSRVMRIRNQVKGNIVPFSSAEMLENSLFQEFLNLGAQPSSVHVEALRVRGSLDMNSRRPVLANLEIEFQGIAGEDSDERMTEFEDRLLTAWLVLGKYATLGKVTLSDVRISVREPTPWDELYDGKTLAGLWTGNVPPEELFPR